MPDRVHAHRHVLEQQLREDQQRFYCSAGNGTARRRRAGRAGHAHRRAEARTSAIVRLGSRLVLIGLVLGSPAALAQSKHLCCTPTTRACVAQDAACSPVPLGIDLWDLAADSTTDSSWLFAGALDASFPSGTDGYESWSTAAPWLGVCLTRPRRAIRRTPGRPSRSPACRLDRPWYRRGRRDRRYPCGPALGRCTGLLRRGGVSEHRMISKTRR